MQSFADALDERLIGFDAALLAKIHDLFVATRMTICVAESMTGGLLGHALTSVDGSSTYFLGGITAYHPTVQVNLLGVSAGSIASDGMVSETVATQMASGAARLMKSDIALSITGFASSGCNLNLADSVGLGYLGWQFGSEHGVKPFRLTGARSEIKHQAVMTALMHLKVGLTQLAS